MVAKKSKKLHLASCKRRPRKIPPLWKFHHDGIRKMRGYSKKGSNTDLTGFSGFVALGHSPVRVKLLHKGKFLKKSGWFCNRCFACTIGSPEALRRKCRGAWRHKNHTFWNAVRIGGGLQAAMAQIENEEVKQWIKANSKTLPRKTDHGHQTVRVLINHYKKFGSVCSICNAANYGSSDSFYSRCKGTLVTRSIKFWQAVEKQGNLEETLALMSEEVGKAVKQWLRQESTGMLRGHHFVTLQVDINASSRHPVRSIKLCKCCNACNYGSYVYFAKECTNQIASRSDKAWKAIRDKGIFHSTIPFFLLLSRTLWFRRVVDKSD